MSDLRASFNLPQLRAEEIVALETEASLLSQRQPHQQREILEQASKAAQTTLDEIHNVGRPRDSVDFRLATCLYEEGNAI